MLFRSSPPLLEGDQRITGRHSVALLNRDGTVGSVSVQKGDAVAAGDPLVTLQ